MSHEELREQFDNITKKIEVRLGATERGKAAMRLGWHHAFNEYADHLRGKFERRERVSHNEVKTLIAKAQGLGWRDTTDKEV